jgi:dTDP-4-dehydrorhamnose 3,5-epimerase
MGIHDEFVQDLLSYSIKGILRGLHYQKQPKAQAKLVAVLRGKIFDVAVDIRKGSPTYGKWVGITLSSNDNAMLYVPKGFAHGFCVQSDEAIIFYKLSSEYDANLDRGVAWNDPEIGIKWPIDAPIISNKDTKWPVLRNADNNFVFGV